MGYDCMKHRIENIITRIQIFILFSGIHCFFRGHDWTIWRDYVHQERGKTCYKCMKKKELKWSALNTNDKSNSILSKIYPKR